ncbi:MAG: PstS family phosphate ABC transporter substrate-binding protein [Panacibacter sp.]
MIARSITLAIIFVALIFNSCGTSNSAENKEVSISFSGAFALYPLVQKWAEEYNKIHPNIRFDIQAGGAGKGLTDAINGAVDVGMFSREITDAEKSKGIWWIALCKDAVLPTMNAQNPYKEMLMLRGLKKEEFKYIFTENHPPTWDSIFKVNSAVKNTISVYTRADAAGAADSWAAYFGKKQDDLKGIGVSGDPGVADAVKKDKNGIGYNNTLFVFDMHTGEKIKGIEVVPIDINGNGRIDSVENIYHDLNTFLEALNEGKYPSPPARDLYFITKSRPQNKAILDFFEWVLKDGQKFVHTAGYVPLHQEVITGQLKKIAPTAAYEN